MSGHVHDEGPACMMTPIHAAGGAMGPDEIPVIHVGNHDVCGAPVIIRGLDDIHDGLVAACALCGHTFRLDPPTQADYDDFYKWAHQFFVKRGAA